MGTLGQDAYFPWAIPALCTANSVFAQVNINYRAKIKEELEYINITVELKDIDTSQNKLIF